MDFEHAIKMDVRNNPIVRELDQARQRELWRSMLVGGALVAVVLFSLWQRFSVMRTATEIETVRKELAQALEEKRRLTLEVEQLSAPGRIEKLAIGQHMLHSDRATTRIIVRPAVLVRGEQATTVTPTQIVARASASEAHR